MKPNEDRKHPSVRRDMLLFRRASLSLNKRIVPLRQRSHHLPRNSREFSVSIGAEQYSEAELTPHGASDDEKDEPWKTLLTMPARCAWRVSESPRSMSDTVGKIVEESGRTRKQLRRSHEAVLQQHRELAGKKERERQRVIQSGQYTNAQRKKDDSVMPVLYGVEECYADFYFRVLPHYAVINRVLEESRSLLGKGTLRPQRVIDFGIGCGSASAAAMDTFGESIEWIHGIDPSQVMREGAEKLLKSLPRNPKTSVAAPSIRTTFSSHLTSESSISQFDLALFAYTAMELPDNSSSLAAAALLWEKLRPGGLFVMVEPGTPVGFQLVRTVRTMLLDRAGTEESECAIVAPCTHNGKCPMDNINLQSKLYKPKKQIPDGEDPERLALRSGYCSFVHTLPSGGGTHEKFSYIVVQKRQRDVTESHAFEGDSLPSLLKRTLSSESRSKKTGTDSEHSKLLEEASDLERRFLDSDDDSWGLELVRGQGNRGKFGRIIHAPKKRKGHIMIDYCVAPGELSRANVTKGMSKRAPGIYSASKKSRWGGLWPNIQLDDSS